MVIAVAGDLNASTAMPIMEKYFGAIPAGPKPEPMTTVEPQQNAEKSVIIREATQPFYIEGYHRSDYLDPDDQVYDAISGYPLEWPCFPALSIAGARSADCC